jgi:alpha-galactosidase
VAKTAPHPVVGAIPLMIGSLASTVVAQIRTPVAPPTPEINGPTVFGVRPGSPMLYKIPATGDGTLSYSVENLPSGLQVDPTTGEITGSLSTEGNYTVTLQATNSLGTNSKNFTIEVGPNINLTPAMGWNSYYAFQNTINQGMIQQQADAMASSGLINYGWSYVNIDDGWQGVRGGTFNGIQGGATTFPDMQGLVNSIHGLDLKVGIYSTPWIQSYAGFIGGSADNPEGTWTKVSNNAQKVDGTYSFAVEDAEQFAAWGIDYLKYDWNPRSPNPVSNAQFYDETSTMAQALAGVNRDIVFSYSNSMPIDQAGVQTPMVNSWRTTGDITDTWASVMSHLTSQGQWAPYSGPSHHIDPDMLMFGTGHFANASTAEHGTQLTQNEQYAQMTAWCLFSAPLIISCDLTQLDPFTLGLLTNPDVIGVDQDALSLQATQIGTTSSGVAIYAKQMADGSEAIGLFNFGSVTETATLNFASLGFDADENVFDDWREINLGNFDGSFSMAVGADSAELIQISDVVPEPATLSLVALSAVGLLRRSRKR